MDFSIDGDLHLFSISPLSAYPEKIQSTYQRHQKLSDVLLRRTFSLEYIFELKELKIGVAQACCPDLFV